MNKTAFESLENRDLEHYLSNVKLKDIAELESLSLSELEMEIKRTTNFGRRSLIAYIISEKIKEVK